MGFNCIGIAGALIAGALLGLSAPGFNQWYLAWFLLAPFLLLSCQSSNPYQAFGRGLAFGMAYNLVYLNWYLGLHPLTWLGFNQWQSILLASASWIVVSFFQAVIYACLALLVKVLPLKAGFLPANTDGRFYLPSLIVIPFLWILLNNKLGNAHELLGVPWTMIEYSQYRQLPLLQVTSLIGGIGLGFLIVMANTALAALVAFAFQNTQWHKLAPPSFKTACRQFLTVALLVALVYSWGLAKLHATQAKAHTVELSVLQGNINIEMQKSKQYFSLAELLNRYQTMAKKCSPGICVLAENALPTYLRKQSQTTQVLSEFARKKNLDLCFGALDSNKRGEHFNSVFAITAKGNLLPSVYHKRYLVPFGEYTPTFVKYLPEFFKRLTNTPAGAGFAAGTKSCILSATNGQLAPLLCFEIVSPEIVAQSVRAGGQLIVNLADLAWFHHSMIGDQMLAFAAVRACENKRYCVFAANSGPSAIIAPSGKILSTSPICQDFLLSGKVALIAETTPFSTWFH